MTCQTCTAPTDSTYLCARCAADLTAVLEQIPDALATVQDTVARLDRVGTGSGRGTERSRPPVNLDALEHQTHLTELCTHGRAWSWRPRPATTCATWSR